MNIEYIGLRDANGPLIVLDGVTDACYEELVEITVGENDRRLGRIIKLEGDKAVIQVFEGTESISLTNTRTRLTGHPLELPVARDMLGRVFDGAGRPIDGLGDICPEKRIDVNGMAINPVSRDLCVHLSKVRSCRYSAARVCRTTSSPCRLSVRRTFQAAIMV